MFIAMNRFCFRMFFLLFVVSLLPDFAMGQPEWAILGAFDKETEPFLECLEEREAEEHLGLNFHLGILRGQSVVVANSGVGKANAAMTTAVLIDHYQPKAVLFSGVAGSLNPKFEPGDVILAKSVCYHDYGSRTDEGFETWPTRNPIDGVLNPKRFPCNRELLRLAEETTSTVNLESAPDEDPAKSPKISIGICSTGDVFVASDIRKREIHETLDADSVDMESAAVAQICHQQRIPFLVVRSISDRADPAASDDFTKFVPIAARNAAAVVIEILNGIDEIERPEGSEATASQRD